MDFVYFFCGLAFLLLAGVLFALRRTDNKPQQWLWLGLFASLMSLCQWLRLVMYSTSEVISLHIIHSISEISAIVCLIEFGRYGLNSKGFRFSRWWLLSAILPPTICLLANPFLCNFMIMFPGMLIGGAFASLSFLRMGLESKGSEKYCLLAAGFLIGTHSIVSQWAVPPSSVFPTNLINETTFNKRIGISPELALLLIISGVFASMWGYYYAVHIKKGDVKLRKSRVYLQIAAGLTLSTIMGLGWLLTANISRNTDAHMRDHLKAAVLGASATLNPIQVSKLTGLPDDIDSDNYLSVCNQLRRIARETRGSRFAYLMGMRNGKVIFLADAEPVNSPDFSPPGQVHSEADRQLKSLFRTGRAAVYGPLRDRWGVWISGYAQIRDIRNNLAIAILGIDIDAANWERELASRRLMPITLTLLAAAVTVLAFSVFLHSRESAAKIAASESRYRSLFEASPNMITLLDNEARYLAINPSGLRILECRESELAGKDFRDTWAEETRFNVENALSNALKGATSDFEANIIRKDGSVLTMRGTINPIPDDANNIYRLVCIANDVTKAKRAEEELKESRRALSTLISNIPGMAYRRRNDKDWTIEIVNDGCISLTGYAPEELLGNANISYEQIIHEEDRQYVWNSVQSAVRERKPFQMTYRITAADGEEKWVWEQGRGIFNDEGELLALEGLIIDITERKHAEEALRKNEQILRQVLDALPVGVWMISPTGDILTVNPAGCEIWGDSELRGMDRYGEYKAWRVSDGKRIEAKEWAVVKALGDGKPVMNELIEIETFDGKRKVVLNSAIPILNDFGEIIAAIAVNQDITSIRRAEMAIQEAEAKYKSIVENSPIGIFQFSLSGKLLSANPALAKILGYDSPKALISLVEKVGRVLFFESNNKDEVLNAAASTEGFTSMEVKMKKRGGSYGSGNLYLRAVKDDCGFVRYFEGFLEDITERKETEAFLRMQTSAINAAGDQIVITNTAGEVEFVNPAFEKETGYSWSEVAGKTLNILKSGQQNAEFYRNLWQTINNGETWHGEIANRRKNGDLFTEDMTITPVKNDAGEIEHFVAIKRNITEKKIYEERLDHLAHHDALTGLPNRLLFSDKLAHKLREASASGKKVAVFFLDLDRFKLINDTLGHNIGDLLLKEVSKRLEQCLRKGDIVARMGGDEFTIIPADICDEEDASKIGRKILNILTKPYLLQGRELFVSASIGISLFPNDGQDVEALVKNADSAMYRAKEQGRNNYQFYTESLNTAAMERMAMEHGLRKAQEQNEFVLYYQPRIDIHTGTTLGVESLLRWQHPEHGLVPPSQFIPLAEENGLIVPISEWVLREACRQAKAWQDDGIPPFVVAVNISAAHLHQGNLASAVQKILKDVRLEPKYLELEITESTLMHDTETAIIVLRKIKEMGVRVSIDDFGTGYSSLSYLKKLPIDALKIDHCFIRDITTNPEDAAIAGAVTAMAHNLHLKVIAEGVETLEQLEFLRSIHCDEVQGYFISRPVPAEQLVDVLREYQPYEYNVEQIAA